MRDIRKDLQERINLLTEQMRSEQAQFDRDVEKIERERDTNINGLKANLEAVHRLIGAEQQRMADTPAVPKEKPQPQEPKAQQRQAAPSQPAKPKPRLPLTEMLGLQRAS